MGNFSVCVYAGPKCSTDGPFNSQRVILLLNNCFLEYKAYDSIRRREAVKVCVGVLRTVERQCAGGNDRATTKTDGRKKSRIKFSAAVILLISCCNRMNFVRVSCSVSPSCSMSCFHSWQHDPLPASALSWALSAVRWV